MNDKVEQYQFIWDIQKARIFTYIEQNPDGKTIAKYGDEIIITHDAMSNTLSIGFVSHNRGFIIQNTEQWYQVLGMLSTPDRNKLFDWCCNYLAG